MRPRSIFLASLAFTALAVTAIAVAHAATVRPNAIDYRIDAIPVRVLLSRPATQLVDPERQVAALRLSRWMFPGWLISILAQIAALFYFWQSGAAARLRDLVRRWTRSEWTVRLLCGAALALVARLASVVPEFYIYRVQRSMSLSGQLFHVWSMDWLLNTAIAMVASGVAVAIALWLVDRTHFWYLYLAGLIVVLSLGIAMLDPIFAKPPFDRIKAPPAWAATTIASVEAAAKRDVPVVMEVRSRSHLGSARVEGLSFQRRIVLSDTIFAVSSPSELRYIVAYELGLVTIDSPLRDATLDALFVILGISIGVAIADRIGFRRDDDPISRLALVAAILGVMYLIVLPIDNTVHRNESASATRYALALTGERAAAVRTTIRAADQSLGEACPNILTRLFFLASLDPSTRVSIANGVPNACPP